MPSSPTPPTDRTALAVTVCGGSIAVMVAVQAPAFLPALSFGAAVAGMLYAFLRL